jgi:methionyl-tRNA synthetase
MTKIMLVTSALPYASGELHLGHLVEHVQSDIWVRMQRCLGQQCYFVCGEDAHGTPMMLTAKKHQLEPAVLAQQFQAAHAADLAACGVVYDNFYTTHSPENQALAEAIYAALCANDDIFTKEVEQLYDPSAAMFLPDRYVKGNCPKCHAAEQYGDSCEQCGAHYSASELGQPRSVVSGAVPVLKTSQQYFFNLPKYQSMLEQWFSSQAIAPEIVNKLQEWLEAGLQAWNISRDAPYFGFKIPGTSDKYFYVWLDAPIGYMASFQNLLTRLGKAADFDATWRADSNTPAEIYHFIGKDIVYFHTLFWPALLHASGHRKPTQVFVHGFLTVNGQKMSKSRGTFITIKQYLAVAEPDYLRYYLASKLSDGIEDLDLHLENFVEKVNADLIGKFVNIASRSASFLEKYFHNRLSQHCYDPHLYQQFVAKRQDIATMFIERQYARAIREIMQLADLANAFINEQRPWHLVRVAETLEQAHAVVSLSINLFWVLATYLQAVLPATTQKICAFLQVANLDWQALDNPLLGHTLASYQPLLTRLETAQLASLVQAESVPVTVAAASVAPAVVAVEELPAIKELISYEDFAKIDLRVARVLSASAVEGADKLLHLQLDLGFPEPKSVFAGIKSAYDPSSLVGKLVAVVANLQPRKMRFGVSNAMLLVAGGDTGQLWLLEPHADASPGMIIR